MVVLLVAASAFFLIPSHNQTNTSLSSTSNDNSAISTLTLAATSANTSSSSSGKLLMEFAFPGVLLASPDLSEMNYTVTLTGSDVPRQSNAESDSASRSLRAVLAGQRYSGKHNAQSWHL